MMAGEWKDWICPDALVPNPKGTCSELRAALWLFYQKKLDRSNRRAYDWSSKGYWLARGEKHMVREPKGYLIEEISIERAPKVTFGFQPNICTPDIPERWLLCIKRRA